MEYDGYLSADETAPGGMLTTTDFDLTLRRIQEKVDLDPAAEPSIKKQLRDKDTVKKFLQAFIAVGRALKTEFDGTFTILSTYNAKISAYGIDRSLTYLRYISELRGEGLMPQSILIPWEYIPAKEDPLVSRIFGSIGEVGGSAVSTAFNKIVVVAAIAGGAYLLLNSLGTKAMKTVASRTSPGA